MPATVARTAYDGQEKAASEAAAVSFEVVKDSKGKVLNPGVLSKTVQSEKDSTDINLILENARKNGGLILNPNTQAPIFQDFSALGDWMSIKSKVARAEAAFGLLPAEIRNKFENNVARLIDFLADPKNDKEAVALNLKPFEVLKTALADDGVTKITQDERESLDKYKAEHAALKNKPA